MIFLYPAEGRSYSYDRRIKTAADLPKGIDTFLTKAWKDAVEKIHPGSKLVSAKIEQGPGPWLATGEFFVQAGAGDVYPRQAVKPDAKALQTAAKVIAKDTERKFGVGVRIVGRPKVKHERFTLGFFLEAPEAK